MRNSDGTSYNTRVSLCRSMLLFPLLLLLYCFFIINLVLMVSFVTVQKCFAFSSAKFALKCVDIFIWPHIWNACKLLVWMKSENSLKMVVVKIYICKQFFPRIYFVNRVEDWRRKRKRKERTKKFIFQVLLMRFNGNLFIQLYATKLQWMIK